MKFELRSNIEVDNDYYMTKLQGQGFSVIKIGDEWCPEYHIEISSVDEMLKLADIVDQEIIYYKAIDGHWILEIYDGYRDRTVSKT